MTLVLSASCHENFTPTKMSVLTSGSCGQQVTAAAQRSTAQHVPAVRCLAVWCALHCLGKLDAWQQHTCVLHSFGAVALATTQVAATIAREMQTLPGQLAIADGPRYLFRVPGSASLPSYMHADSAIANSYNAADQY